MDAFPVENVEKPHGTPKSRIKLFLTVATIFLLVTTIIFIVLFVYYYIKFDEQDKPTVGSVSTAPVIASTDKPTDGTISTTPVSVSTDTPTGDSVCTTPDCVSTAALMLKNMNLSVDPCVDFNEFACGRYNREAPFREGSERASKLFDQIIQENDLVMKDIITEVLTTEQPQYLQKMKRFYKSCLNIDKIENTPLHTIVNSTFHQDWPTLEPDWDNSTFNLKELIIRYAKAYTQPLFTVTVSPNLRNTTRNDIYVDKPETLPDNPELLSEVAIVLGANRTTAEEDVKEVINLSYALSKTKNLGAFVKEKLGNVSAVNVLVDLPGVIRAVFGTVNMKLEDDTDVIIEKEYMEQLNVTLNKFSSRAIQNYFGFSYALPRVMDMSDSLRRKAGPEKLRWKTCLEKSKKYFWKAMSKQFVARKFSNETKVSFEKMIDNLKETFRQILRETTWLSAKTKAVALSKLAVMTYKIGYPDTGFTDADIDKEYEEYDMNESTYNMNERLIETLIHKKDLSKLNDPVDKKEWVHWKPIEANAANIYDQNSMEFPAAFLQPPNFSPSYPDALNYGALGAVIGHEITHGYDTSGGRFDEKGNLVDWWQPSDKETFKEKVQCIVDQASKFKFDEVNMTLNLENVKGEIISDNGGLKESYRAYKELAAKKGENKTLPGLKLNFDQLFFLAFGQNWCEKLSLGALRWILKYDEHPPARLRIIGTLQNSEEFAKAYNCPLGSPMNPVKKCSVW